MTKAHPLEDKLGTCYGEVLVRPWGKDRQTLSDPYSIFPVLPEARPPITPDGWITLDHNLVVNNGRQVLANLLGGRDYTAGSASDKWIVSQVSFGSFDQAPRFDDTTLSPQPRPGFTGGENTIPINGAGDKFKKITAVDWPQPFLVRFEIELGLEEANGYLIREMGLFTTGGDLFARKTTVPVSKKEAYGLTWLWRVRT